MDRGFALDCALFVGVELCKLYIDHTPMPCRVCDAPHVTTTFAVVPVGTANKNIAEPPVDPAVFTCIGVAGALAIVAVALTIPACPVEKQTSTTRVGSAVPIDAVNPWATPVAVTT